MKVLKISVSKNNMSPNMSKSLWMNLKKIGHTSFFKNRHSYIVKSIDILVKIIQMWLNVLKSLILGLNDVFML